MSEKVTKEEARDMFINQMKMLVNYWSMQDGSKHDVLAGLLHSMFVTFDGGAFSCAIDLVLAPHKDDKQYAIDNDEDWIESGMVINDDVHLKDMIYKNGRF